MKQNTILAAIFFFLLAIGLSATCQEPRNLQVRVLQVIKQKGHRIDLTALSMQGDTVYVKYGFRGWRNKRRAIAPGTWLTVQAYYSDRQREWYCRKITINN